MDTNKRFKKVAVESALAAGKLLTSRMGRIKRLSFKGGSATNIVTDVDKKSEQMIIKRIKSQFAGHQILAEESGKDELQSEYRWVIDPIDGTTNFIHNFPFFCVSIGLEKKGRPLIGVVYDPIRNELFFAEKNKGAYLNNKRIKVSKINDITGSLLATGFAYDVNKSSNNDNINNFKRVLETSQAVRRAGSAALDLCYVASGRFEGFWELDLNPWDTAAAFLIVQEAGGRVTKFDGTKYTPYEKNILATNGKIHNKMIAILNKGYK